MSGCIKKRAMKLAEKNGLTYETVKKVVKAKDAIADRNKRIIEEVEKRPNEKKIIATLYNVSNRHVDRIMKADKDSKTKKVQKELEFGP